MAANKAEDLSRDNTRLKVLTEVSHAFATVGTDYQKLLDKIARSMADLIGDACMVTLLDDDGENMISVSSAHRDRNLENDYKIYLAGMRVSKATSNSVSALVARTGQAKIADVKPGDMVAQTDISLKPIVERLNVHSYAVIPIRARGFIIGTLSLLRSIPSKSYTSNDVTLLQDLADRAGLAIENARLYEELELRVRQRTTELRAVNEELEAFSDAVAHDLRAPLRSIDGFTKVTLEDYAECLGHQGREHLVRVRNASRRMTEIVEGLLHLSKTTRSELTREIVDLSKLAETIMDRLRAAQPERRVEFKIAPGLIAHADPKLLDVVLTNLLGNAWKFTSNQPTAHIEFAIEDGEPMVFFIRDNGAGFDPTYSAKLFGAFQRLHNKNEFEDTGIGLATVRRIVVRHGGKIWAKGERDRGATFFFTLEHEVPT